MTADGPSIRIHFPPFDKEQVRQMLQGHFDELEELAEELRRAEVRLLVFSILAFAGAAVAWSLGVALLLRVIA